MVRGGIVDTIKAVLLIVGGIIIIGLLIVIVLDQIYGVQFAKTLAKGIVALITPYAPSVGGALNTFVDTIIWI